ncbi:hypothetical protein FB157_102140 [Streptomyces sp. BK340]|nr:hypothetical protein FB157_102140 [Streptomyces sp. BK340]
MHGYTVAIRWAAGIMLLAGLVAGLTGTARAPGHGARTGGRGGGAGGPNRRASRLAPVARGPVMPQWRPATRSAICARREDSVPGWRSSRRSAAR